MKLQVETKSANVQTVGRTIESGAPRSRGGRVGEDLR